MEREELQPGVGVDVASTDLHESSADGKHFQPGALCGAGQGVEHDVDAVAVGVAADLLGELRCCGSRRHARYPCRATVLAADSLPAVAKISAPAARAIAIAACPTLPVAE